MTHLKSINDIANQLQKDIASHIRTARVKLCLTQADLALKADVSRATVIAAEAGQGVSSLNLFALLASLGLTLIPGPAHLLSQPRLNDSMRAERERQAILRSVFDQPTVETTVTVSPESDNGLTTPNNTAHRPRLKDLMKEERIRMAVLRTGVPMHEQ